MHEIPRYRHDREMDPESLTPMLKPETL